MKKLFLLLVAVMSIALCASAQMRTVSGSVVYAGDDEPLIGATITPLGSTDGVVTDINGNFSIQVGPDVHKLKVSYVGMHSQEVAIPASGKLVVKLDNKENVLDEVMVVAYGTVKKSEYTGSAAVVTSDQLETALVSNVTNALSGKMAGVQTLSSNGQPGVSSSVLIRGVGSINTSTTPLFVIDGIPFDGDISSIPTTDIDQLTVLKDAASTALYGARGANGVILITTKKGQAGKTKVSVDARWGGSSRAVPNYDVITDQRQYLETAYQALYNTYTGYNGMTPEAAHDAVNRNIWNTLGYQTWTIPDGQTAFGRNGKFNPNATPGYSNGRYYFIADDWEKESLRHGFRQEYNVNITGGNDRFSFYISGSYLGDEGMVENSSYDRFASRVSIDYQAYKWLKIGTNMSYTYSKSQYPRDQTDDSATSSGNTFYFVNSLGPMYPMYVRNADGTIMMNDIYHNPIFDYGDGKDYGNGLMGSSRTPQGNPKGSLLYDQEEYLSDIFDGKWYAVLTPFEGFTLSGTLNMYVDNTRQHQILNPLYGQFANMGGQAIQVAERVRSFQGQVIASYNHTFGDDHTIDLMAGYEEQDFQDEYVQALGSNLYNPSSFVINNTIDDKRGYGAQANLVHKGWIGRVKYNYAGRYYFQGSFRRDGSSRFAPSKRWGSFWSVSAGWDIDKEKFMQDYTWIDLLKLKASFGQNGNDRIGSSTAYMAYTDIYQMTGANGVFSDGTLWYKGNPDISWEKSNNFNVGFDFAFLNGKIQGSAEYYSRQTNDMLFNIPVQPSMGYSTMPMNIGSMRNNGFEIDLTYRLVDTKDIDWSVFANITLPKNKIIKLDPSILDKDGMWWRSTYQFCKEGESMYQWAPIKYAGVNENGQALYWAKKTQKDENGNEIILDEEYTTTDALAARRTNRTPTGDIMPDGYGGFGTTLNAYGFDFSIQFAYQFGGRIMDYGYMYTMQPGTEMGAAWHKDVLNAWTPDNTGSDIPALYTSAKEDYADALSDRFLTSSDYLSLNNITAGYTLPRSFTKKFGVEGLRLYFAAENVALWSKRKGLDPRQSFYLSNNRTYAPMRTFTGGIHIDF